MELKNHLKHNFSHYALWGLALVLYYPAFRELYRMRWKTIDYTHAYFILPVSLWLAWRKRAQLKEILRNSAQGRDYVSFAFLVFGAAMLVFGWRNDYAFIYTLSLFPFLFGVINFLYGKAMWRALLFPVAYLLLLVPPPSAILDGITLPLRYGISIAVEIALKSFDYPITRDGLILSVDGSEIFMGQPCSGLRSLMAMISLGVVYVYVNKGVFKKNITLILSIIPLTLLGNFIRVAGMCLVTYYFGKEDGEKFHDASGFVIFMVLLFGLMWIESIIDKKAMPKKEEENDYE